MKQTICYIDSIVCEHCNRFPEKDKYGVCKGVFLSGETELDLADLRAIAKDPESIITGIIFVCDSCLNEVAEQYGLIQIID